MINDLIRELKYQLDETRKNICKNGLTDEIKEEMDSIFSMMINIQYLAEPDDDLKNDMTFNFLNLSEDFLEAKKDNNAILRLCCEMEETSDWLGEEVA